MDSERDSVPAIEILGLLARSPVGWVERNFKMNRSETRIVEISGRSKGLKLERNPTSHLPPLRLRPFLLATGH